ncbi:MAG: hypothetical protein HUJ57_01015 [Erysipelotrichaceae bacterium]|nr:hypothetical protein [Erysipelotrichaceae bacterium]
MGALKRYTCPNCGATLEFDTGAGELKCPYCDTVFELEALEAYNQDLTEQTQDEIHFDASLEEFGLDEQSGLAIYKCNSCGGEIVTDKETGATNCPYCGNPVVMTQNFEGDLRPEYVIPFKYDKKQAKEELMKHFTGKKLLPDVFKDQNHIDEMKGIYVPFWLFDGSADARARFKGTRMRTWQDSRYIYTETSHYAINRAGSMDFEKIPVDASSKINDVLMESIEPYDYSALVEFDTAYLSGFMAERYTKNADENNVRADQRIRNTLEQSIRSSVMGYSTLVTDYMQMSIHDGKAHYALLPVWLLTTSWNGEEYYFAMNGQTGKMVGDLPADKGKTIKSFFVTFGITTAVVLAIALAVSFLG